MSTNKHTCNSFPNCLSPWTSIRSLYFVHFTQSPSPSIHSETICSSLSSTCPDTPEFFYLICASAFCFVLFVIFLLYSAWVQKELLMMWRTSAFWLTFSKTVGNCSYQQRWWVNLTPDGATRLTTLRIVRVYMETHVHVHMQTNTLLCTWKCFLHTTCSRRSFICLEGCSCHLPWICWHTRTLWHCSTNAGNHKCWLYHFTAAFYHLRCTTQKAHSSRSRSGLIFIFRHLQSWPLCPFPEYPYVNGLWILDDETDLHCDSSFQKVKLIREKFPWNMPRWNYHTPKKYSETFSDQYFVIKKRPFLLKTCRRN